MAQITVNNITLAYDILGKGTPLVWTPGGWFPRNNWTYLAAGFQMANYQNLVWDRRNSGVKESRDALDSRADIIGSGQFAVIDVSYTQGNLFFQNFFQINSQVILGNRYFS